MSEWVKNKLDYHILIFNHNLVPLVLNWVIWYFVDLSKEYRRVYEEKLGAAPTDTWSLSLSKYS